MMGHWLDELYGPGGPLEESWRENLAHQKGPRLEEVLQAVAERACEPGGFHVSLSDANLQRLERELSETITYMKHHRDFSLSLNLLVVADLFALTRATRKPPSKYIELYHKMLKKHGFEPERGYVL